MGVCAALVLLVAWASAGAAAWPTGRGNPERTGNLDDRPGPAAPKVLWVYKALEHFIASPVPGAGALYVSGLGTFNTGNFHGLALADTVADRVLWTKTAPYVTRPVVCAPAVAEGLVVFGDGMHQTDGAVLYCLRADGGRPVWQLPVPGKLVHLEGSPTIDKGRVFIGGGDAGVLCVDLKRVVLDGQEQDLAAVKALMDKRWAELLAKFDEDRKKDPTFAVPPGDEALPKPAPKVLWQKGQGAWHVDAPVAVVGDRVLVASSYLDEEKIGKRALLCLNAADGNVVWEVPLKINPWAGPTVAGNLVLVGCSTIRFDTKRIQDARGEVVAVDLAGGQVKWRKDIPGGVLASVAVKNGLAVFAATDGKVRACDAATGAPKWVYDGGAAFFAGPAVAGGVVYAANLKAALHAIGLADGKRLWTLDVGGHPHVQAPGMIFASPVVHGGQIYLATCNLEGRSVEQPCAVVCLSDKAGAVQVGGVAAVAVDKQKRTVAVPCKVAPRRLPTLKDIYPLEVVATYPSPRGQKAHETVVTFDVRPTEVHQALESLGLKPGKPARGGEGTASGPEVSIYLEFTGITGTRRRIPIEKVLVDGRTGKPMPPLKWYFTGSAMRQVDPDKPDKVYGADLAGTLISLFPVTDETVFQTNLTMEEERLLGLETNKNVLPEEGTVATLIIEVK